MNRRRALVTSLLLLVAMPDASNAASRALTADDYLCTIYPPGCPKAATSMSSDLVYITLGRPDFSKPSVRPAPRETETIALPRAFIDWLPYLKPEPQSMVAIEAAIPDFSSPVLVPDSLWKQSVRERPEFGISPETSENAAHQHWVRIELSLKPDFSRIDCAKEYCPPTIEAKLLSLRTEDFVAESNESNLVFARYLPRPKTTPYYQFENKELVLPRHSVSPTYLICDRAANPLFNWCKVETTLDDGSRVSYGFEAKFLDSFPKVDLAVRNFCKEIFLLGKKKP